jgi:hypothetical protein
MRGIERSPDFGTAFFRVTPDSFNQTSAAAGCAWIRLIPAYQPLSAAGARRKPTRQLGASLIIRDVPNATRVYVRLHKRILM